MAPEVALSLSSIHVFGQTCHIEYIIDQLDKITAPLSDTVKRNKRLTTSSSSGACTQLEPNRNSNTPISKRDGQYYLKSEENKNELFSYIGKQLANTEMDVRLLLSTDSEMVLSDNLLDVSALQPCNQAEAHMLIILH